jgi:sugar phosphate isomerase/epimerase
MCDLAGVPRELAADGDRILPGDGDLQLSALVGFLRQIDYDGWISVELMNPTLWRTSPSLVAKMAFDAMAKFRG